MVQEARASLPALQRLRRMAARPAGDVRRVRILAVGVEPIERILSQVEDCPPEELEIGMPVEVVFDDVTEEVTLPRFRRLRS